MYNAAEILRHKHSIFVLVYASSQKKPSKNIILLTEILRHKQSIFLLVIHVVTFSREKNLYQGRF